MDLRYFIVIQGSAVYADIGPYIQVCLEDAYKGSRHATVNSIYRGPEAESILNRHGKSSQAQLYQGWINHRPGFLPANPPGHSTHELRSDGVAYPGIPSGGPLEWWMQGFDTNDVDVEAVVMAAAHKGWSLFRPYPGGAEHHHLNFRERPKRPPIGSEMWRRMVRIRATYPRS